MLFKDFYFLFLAIASILFGKVVSFWHFTKGPNICMRNIWVKRFEVGPAVHEEMMFKEFSIFLTHWIRISEILTWDRKSYLTHAILPRLSREGYIHWLHWNLRTLLSKDAIVMLKWRHHVKLYLSIFRTSGSLFLNKKQRWANKMNPLFVWG